MKATWQMIFMEKLTLRVKYFLKNFNALLREIYKSKLLNRFSLSAADSDLSLSLHF